MQFKPGLSLNILFIFFFPVLTFSQGYYNEENFGNRSILLSGNVTGSVDDLGLTYYNPARLAIIEEPVFSINAKAYQYSSLKLKNVFGKNSKLSDAAFEGIPSMIAGTYSVKKWPKHKFAYAFLSKKRAKLGFNLSREFDPVEGELGTKRLSGDFDFENSETDEWFGGSWAMKLRDNLSIGVSGFASVYNLKGLYDLRFAAEGEPFGVDVYNNQIKMGQNSYGLFWKVGLAWTFKSFDLGLNVDFPYLEVIGNGKFRYQNYLSGTDPENGDFQYYNFKDLNSSRRTPLGISLGVGLPLGNNTFHFKADWHAGVPEYNRLVIPTPEDTEEFIFKESLRSVVNFGLGAEIYLNDKLNVYASVSTDFSPIKASANIFDFINRERDSKFDSNFMHYGLGINVQLEKMKLILGGTYSNASGKFGDPVDIPLSVEDPGSSNDSSRISVNRYRFILGLEIPIFGYDLELK